GLNGVQDSLLLSTLTVSQCKVNAVDPLPKTVLHGTGVAMYIVGQERRLVDPPSQVVAGVRTVTTNMDGGAPLARVGRPSPTYVAAIRFSGQPAFQAKFANGIGIELTC